MCRHAPSRARAATPNRAGRTAAFGPGSRGAESNQYIDSPARIAAVSAPTPPRLSGRSATPSRGSHTVMYTYFAITAAGFAYPAKFLITAMQICQFIIGFAVVWPYGWPYVGVEVPGLTVVPL